MNAFWPRASNPLDHIGVRLGRLLFWAGAAGAVAWVVLALIWQSNGNGYATPAGLGVAVLFFIGGRALRYLLAGE